MQLTVRRESQDVLLTPLGEVDLHSAPQIATIGMLAIREPVTQRLVVDLSGVTFVDSYGLGMLVQLHQGALDAGARLLLRRPQPQLLRILQVTDLGGLFEVDP